MMEVVFHKGDIYLCTKGKVCVFEIYNIYCMNLRTLQLLINYQIRYQGSEQD